MNEGIKIMGTPYPVLTTAAGTNRCLFVLWRTCSCDSCVLEIWTKCERYVRTGSPLTILSPGTKISHQVLGTITKPQKPTFISHILTHYLSILFCRFYALAAVYNQVIIGLIVAEIKPYINLNTEDQGILPAAYAKNADVGYILSLGVSKQFRRNGIASLLLDSLLGHLTTVERRKVKAVFLHVLTTNSAAILFYEHRRYL